jgi:hypothetical protein
LVYDNSEPVVDQIIGELGVQRSNRGNWETHWQEIAERIWPAHARLFSSLGYNPTTGEKRNEQVFDSTAAVARGRFGAIVDSLLTPRNSTWHRLKASDRALDKVRGVRLWFDEVNQVLFKYRYAPKANFAGNNQLVWQSLGAYGSGPLFIDRLAGEPGIRYRHIHLSEAYFCENHQGVIDTMYRPFRLTARQAIQQFGEDKLPAQMKEQGAGNKAAQFEFIHCVKPRSDVDPRRIDSKGLPFASYYVSVLGKVLLEESGYGSFPYPTARYELTSGEVYGRSPAMDVLPAIKTLNEEKKTVLKQGHRTVDPVLLAYDDGVVDGFSLRPGAINPGGVSADGRALVQALQVGNIAIGKELMDDERMVINDAFLVTLFQILVETPQMTATEVLERTREKGILLAPTIGRQQSEYLGPVIERELDVLAQQRLIPPMPPELREAQGQYKVVYDSPLSRAQRAEEAAGLSRTVEFALNAVNITQNPEPLDHIKWDVAIPEIADIQAVPARWMNSAEEVAQIRAGRQKQAEMQQMIQAAPGAAAMVKAGAVAQKGAAK